MGGPVLPPKDLYQQNLKFPNNVTQVGLEREVNPDPSQGSSSEKLVCVGVLSLMFAALA